MAYKRISPQPVVEGGTGVESNTAYAVLCGGTTATSGIQSIAGVGTSGQILTSNGAAALPTFQAPAAPPSSFGVTNLGITYASGTGLFSVTSEDGTALSASNPGSVTLSSKASPGELVTISITADQTFTDDNGSSTIIGNLFGLTTSIAYANDLPFFIYAVLNDDEDAISFMISRYPAANLSPPTTRIGKTGSAIADTAGSFFALDDPTVANYDLNPCLAIGAFRMRMSASDDWTVQALSNGSGQGFDFPVGADGIGHFHEESTFYIARGQFGAASDSHFRAGSGTAPVFDNAFPAFSVTRSGRFTWVGKFQTLSTSGVGTDQLTCLSPYPIILLTEVPAGVFIAVLNTVVFNGYMVQGVAQNGMGFRASTDVSLQNGDVTATSKIHFQATATIYYQ